MAMIELVDFNDIYTGSKKGASAAKPKATRRRAGKKAAAKKGEAGDAAADSAE
jgi:hypothetical protein